MSKVTVGVSTIVGFAAAAAAAIAPLIGEFADAAAPLGVSPELWLKVSAALTLVTVFGRMWQAAAAAGRNTIVDPAVEDPDVEDEGSSDPADIAADRPVVEG